LAHVIIQINSENSHFALIHVEVCKIITRDQFFGLVCFLLVGNDPVCIPVFVSTFLDKNDAIIPKNMQKVLNRHPKNMQKVLKRNPKNM